MLRKIAATALCSGLLFLAACEETPESAKGKLEELGIEFNMAGYLGEAEKGNAETVQLFLDAGIAPLLADEATGVTALMKAAESGNAELVRLLLERAGNVSAIELDSQRDKEGRVTMHYAAKGGSIAVYDLLRQKGARADVQDLQNNTLLHFAAQGDRPEIIDRITQDGQGVVMVDARNIEGETAALVAVKQGKLGAVQALAGKNADLNLGDLGEVNPLMVAAQKGDAAMVTGLIQLGAKPDVYDMQGRTPLYYAIAGGQLEAVQALLAGGAGINFAKEGNPTPLQYALQQTTTTLDMVKVLQAAGADLEKPYLGRTALSLAFEGGNKEVVEFLINQGADVNKLGDSSENALNIALSHGHEDLAIMALEKGADMYAQNSQGMLPLEIAVKRGHKEVVKHMIAKKVEVNTTTSEGLRPADIAVYKGDADILELLLVAGAKLNTDYSLIRAVIEGKEGVVRVLLKYGASSEVTNANGEPVLWLAASRGQLKAVEALLENGADVDLPSLKDGTTPLAMAAAFGYDEIAQLLLAAGASVNRQDLSGNTPLAHAVIHGKAKLVARLIKAGADVNAHDNQGRSILDMSVYNAQADQSQQIPVLLREAGAK